MTRTEIERQAPKTIFALDNQLTIIFWSSEAEQMYGYSRVQAVGKDFRQLIRFEMIDCDEQSAWETLVRDGQWRGDAYHYTASGNRIRVRCHTRFLKDYKHNVVGIAANVVAVASAEG
jgi:PAS domain S-box-containing protein